MFALIALSLAMPPAFQVENRVIIPSPGSGGYPVVSPEQVWDRCSKGETLTVVIGSNNVPAGACLLLGKLEGKRAGVYGAGTYRCMPDGKGGVAITPVVQSYGTYTMPSDCPNGRCPLVRP